jgi:peptidyl-Lys metalloendopeptidase
MTMQNIQRRIINPWLGLAAIAFVMSGCLAAPDESSGNSGDNAKAQGAQVLDSDLGQLAFTVSAPKASVTASESPYVTVSVTNNASHSIRLLKWQTSVLGVDSPIFEVTRDGVAVDYVGRVYKRPAPTASDYVVLAPNQTVTNTVDLGESYDLSTSGNYSVRFQTYVEHEESSPEPSILLSSNAIGLWLEGRPGAQMAAESLTPGYASCSSTQKTAIATALKNASVYANGALTYMNGTPGSTARFTTWFGTYTSSRWTSVQSHYSKMKSAFDSKTFSFDCACSDSAYAYTYPTQPYKIYLCSAFWSASATGTDSKAGTIVHETSHFNVIAGTQDYAYGQTAAKSLAKSSPAKAILNADSHEYFAENSPALN